MAETPWWALPVVAAVFALGGCLATLAVTANVERARRVQAHGELWYTDRLAAYVALLAAFQRSVARLRRGFADGVLPPDVLHYLDEVGTALMQVRLLASLPVRNSALAAHRLIEDLHGRRADPATAVSADPEFLDRLAHVPLAMQAFEAAVRAELGIDISGRPEPGSDAAGPAPTRSGLELLRRRTPPATRGEVTTP